MISDNKPSDADERESFLPRFGEFRCTAHEPDGEYGGRGVYWIEELAPVGSELPSCVEGCEYGSEKVELLRLFELVETDWHEARYV